LHEKAPRFLYSVHFPCWTLSPQGETFIKGVYDIDLMTMTDIDTLAIQLKSMTPNQLQQLISATANRDGSEIKARKIRATETYFRNVKNNGLYPHNFESFPQFREVLP
jgi:hypothetical protein